MTSLSTNGHRHNTPHLLLLKNFSIIFFQNHNTAATDGGTDGVPASHPEPPGTEPPVTEPPATETATEPATDAGKMSVKFIIFI